MPNISENVISADSRSLIDLPSTATLKEITDRVVLISDDLVTEINLANATIQRILSYL